MNKLTAIHEYIYERMADLLPGSTRLSNPYKPEENASLAMKNGFGASIGSGQNSSDSNQPITRVRRSFGIVLTREYFAREDDGEKKAVAERLLVEDIRKIEVDFQTNYDMDELALRSRWIGDSGIEYVSSNTDRFLMIQAEIEVDYFEANT